MKAKAKTKKMTRIWRDKEREREIEREGGADR